MRDGVARATLAEALGEGERWPQLLTAAAWRWLSASVSGLEPVTADVVRQMAEDVWTREARRPIDGGTLDSPPHATAERSDAPANGWVHDAALVEREDGSVELMLWCELSLDVYELVDSGRLAYASILASLPETGSAVLHSIALTNLPGDPRVGAASVERTTGLPTPIAGVAGALRRAGGQEMTDTKPVAEAAREAPADAPAEARETMTPDEMAAKLEELAGKIAALEEMLAARTAELAEARSQGPAETAEQVVERAIREGKIKRSDRALWIGIGARSAAGLDVLRQHVAETQSIYARVTSAESAQHAASMLAVRGPEEDAIERAIALAPPALAARIRERKGGA